MSRGVLCDVCGAVAPTTVARDFQTDGAPPDGWYGAFLTTGGSLQRPEAAGDLCSPACLERWAHQRAEEWREQRNPPRRIRLGTDVHRRRYDLNPPDPLAVTCPTCSAVGGQPCDTSDLPVAEPARPVHRARGIRGEADRCPQCKAAPGEPCVSAASRAIRVWTSRFDAEHGRDLERPAPGFERETDDPLPTRERDG